MGQPCFQEKHEWKTTKSRWNSRGESVKMPKDFNLRFSNSFSGRYVFQIFFFHHSRYMVEFFLHSVISYILQTLHQEIKILISVSFVLIKINFDVLWTVKFWQSAVRHNYKSSCNAICLKGGFQRKSKFSCYLQ